MNFDLNDIYSIFDEVKEKHDLKEYSDEMGENNRILNEIPFDTQKARQQISKLADKYRFERNQLSHLYGNNMSVTNQPVQRHQRFYGMIYNILMDIFHYLRWRGKELQTS